MNIKKALFPLVCLLLASIALPAQPVMHPTPPRAPDFVVFAGDTLRLDRQDFRERMDRELISFTYMHTNSTLMLRRSRRLFSFVTPILKEQGIPEDLKYLMAIESNLDLLAVSATGASGLWQFTKATAATYKLEVSAEVDERFHPDKETLAACQYLKDAYKKFGDWITVAASYNMGQNGIAARLAEQKQTSALELFLKEETSRYMFRLLACKLFFENPAAFGYRISPQDLYPPFPKLTAVSVSGPVNWIDFALEHHTTYAALRNANPWIRDTRLTNKAGKTYWVLIP